MYTVMTPNEHFTDITVEVLTNAKKDHLPTLIGQLLLDADIDVLYSLDAHLDFKGLAVLSEWHSLKTDCGYIRTKFLHVMACAMAAHFLQLGI